ncbi:AMP-binding protein [Polymorphospora sp. NPDC051019]|uniref:class I adenylate-forming enzyme family protein n=1 Tax=Polymorphospora sp. NPDC051019 TaxID=3155725 RepID=UPI0034448FFB
MSASDTTLPNPSRGHRGTGETVNFATGRGIVELIHDRARSRAEHAFLFWDPMDAPVQTWSYARFAHDVDAVAAGLLARGVRPGDRVAIVLDNCPEFAITWAALLSVGAVAVCLNTRSSTDELVYYAGHSGVVGVVTQPAAASRVATAMRDVRWTVVTAGDGDHRARDTPAEPGDTFEALRGDPSTVRRVLSGPLDPATIQYTSGTTSRPKAVLWTHANCLWAGRVNATHEGLRPDDVHLISLPLFHANALGYSLLPTLWAGASAVLLPRFSASRFWEVSLRHRCTWASMVRFTYQVLATHEVPAGHSYRRWGHSFCASAETSYAGTETIGWYGMTETVSHPLCGELHQSNQDGSIGRPTPEYGVAVVDGQGRPVGPGEPGELLVRGVPGISLFGGYAGDPAATADAYDEAGWFRTGDRVRYDEAGVFRFVDRAKDMLKVGGENIAALEVETVLLDVPGVREAAVVGRPDPVRGEVPVAFVAAAGPDGVVGERALAECRRRLADFKVPARVVVLSELPRTTIHKIAKSELRALARDLDLG